MGAGEIYRGIEDTWYSILDAMSDKGVPVYSIVDPIENMGVPSLPLFIGVLVILVALIGYVFIGGGVGAGTVTVTVSSDGELLENALVIAGGLEVTTDESGFVELDLPREEVEVEVSAPDCQSQTEFVTPPAELEFELMCKIAPPVAGCSTIAEEYDTATVVGEMNTPLVDCSVIALDGGDPVEIEWGIDGNTMFLDDSVCLQDDYQIQISCLEHARTLFIDELREEMLTRGEVIVQLKGIEQGDNAADCDRDGIPDVRDKDNDNDGIFDIDDLDVDGDGINNAQDADSCGQDTRVQEFIPPVDPDVVTVDDIPGPSEPEVDNTYLTYVTMVADTGEKLDGMTVTAVDSSDNKLETGYENTIVEDNTVNGSATLKLPSGQRYYITAGDPKNYYRSTKSQLLIQNRQQEIRLIMQKGFPTTITVLGDGVVSYATVRILDDPVMEKESGANGKAVFVLDKGEIYDAEITHEDYIPLKTTISGGVDAQVILELVDESNAGSVRTWALNAQGIEEGMNNVLIELITAEDMVYQRCKTSGGQCDFKNVLVGEYTLRATPPGAVDYQESEKFSVAAGLLAEQQLLINPAEVELRVLTKIGGNPAKDVKVTLYDVSYGIPEKIDTAKSGDNRRVKFTTFRGKRVYLEAEYEEFGPTATSPFTLTGNKDMDIDLKEVMRSVSFVAPTGGEISAGETKDAKLVIELPFADEKNKKTYKSVVAEIWTGDPGQKANPAQTPIVLGAIDSYVFEKQQRPRVTVAASDSYAFRQEEIHGDPATTSKFLRFSITDYAPSVYEITVPMFARRESKGDVTVRYRATWIDEERRIFTSHGDDWGEATVHVIESDSDDKADWIETLGDFSSHNAFISNTPVIEEEEEAEEVNIDRDVSAVIFFPIDYEPEEIEVEDTVPVFTDGSLVFLHVRAIAARETDNYLIKIDSFPPVGAGEKHLIPLAYRGVIRKNNGNSRLIYPALLDGNLPISVSPVEQSKEYYSLDVNDEIELVIAFRASGGVDLAELALFNDLDNTIEYKVKEISETFVSTPVANVEARMQILTELCPKEPYLGGCVEGETTSDQILPSYDLKRVEGRKFSINLELNNTEPESQNMLLRIEATGVELGGYKQMIPLGGNGLASTKITGVGSSAQGGEINIYLWAEGLEEQLWKTIEHGIIDYEIKVVGINADGTLLPDNVLGTHTKEIIVQVLRKSLGNPQGEEIVDGFDTNGHADAIRLAKDRLEAWASFGLDFEGGAGYSAKELELDWGFLTVQVGHPEFEWLERAFEVHGSLFEPLNANNSFVLDDRQPTKEFNYAIITNNWDEALKVDVEESLDMAPAGQSYGLATEIRVYDAQGFEIDADDRNSRFRDVPSRGKAELWISSAPPGTGCNVAPSVNKFEVETETKNSNVVDTGNYQVTFSCDFEGGPQAQDKMLANKVLREDDKPNDITADSCSAAGEVAYICDAEQFSIALMRGAKELHDSQDIDLVKSFALADDLANPAVMSMSRRASGLSYPLDVVYGETGAPENSLILSQKDIGCGFVTVMYEKLTGGKIKATIEVDNNAGWCGGANAFIGLLNYDDDLRTETTTDQIVKYVGFADDAAAFQSSVVKYVPLKHFFGYFDVTDVEGDFEAPHVVYYKEWEASEFAGNTDPLYTWLKPAYASTGYFNINEQGDVQIGIIYTERDNLDKHRDCMMSNLVNYWTLGDGGSLRVGGNRKQTFDLDNCINTPGLRIPVIDEMQLDSLTPEVEDADATGDPVIAVRLSTNMEVRACYLWNYKDERPNMAPDAFDSGSYEKDSYAGWTGNRLVVDNWDLDETDDGLYTVKAACVSVDGFWSEREVRRIILDRNAPVILDIDIEDSTIQKIESISFTVRDKYPVDSCMIDRYCPTPFSESGCGTLGDPDETDEVYGNIYRVTCDTPTLVHNADIKGLCIPTGNNLLNVTCTDIHGNKGGLETKTFRLSEEELNKPIDYSCDSGRDGYIDRIRTSAGTLCEQWGTDFPIHGFLSYGNDLIVNSDSLMIPIAVTAKNPITGCDISKGTTTVSCGLPTKTIDEYKKFYDCSTDSALGAKLLEEGRNTGVTITCQQEGDDPIDPYIMEDIIVDLTPPDLCTITGGEDVGNLAVFVEEWYFARKSMSGADAPVTVNYGFPDEDKEHGRRDFGKMEFSLGSGWESIGEYEAGEEVYVETVHLWDWRGEGEDFIFRCLATDIVGHTAEGSQIMSMRELDRCRIDYPMKITDGENCRTHTKSNPKMSNGDTAIAAQTFDERLDEDLVWYEVAGIKTEVDACKGKWGEDKFYVQLKDTDDSWRQIGPSYKDAGWGTDDYEVRGLGMAYGVSDKQDGYSLISNWPSEPLPFLAKDARMASKDWVEGDDYADDIDTDSGTAVLVYLDLAGCADVAESTECSRNTYVYNPSGSKNYKEIYFPPQYVTSIIWKFRTGDDCGEESMFEDCNNVTFKVYGKGGAGTYISSTVAKFGIVIEEETITPDWGEPEDWYTGGTINFNKETWVEAVSYTAHLGGVPDPIDQYSITLINDECSGS